MNEWKSARRAMVLITTYTIATIYDVWVLGRKDLITTNDKPTYVKLSDT